MRFITRLEQTFAIWWPLRTAKFSWVAIIILISSCRNNESGIRAVQDQKKNSFESLPEDFKNFYTQFHADSVFQINHIFFPLEGLPNHADPAFIGDEKFFWSADQWIFQKSDFQGDHTFESDYLNLKDVLIEEKIKDIKNDLTLIRRFAKTGDGWRLIYYAGMNKYSSVKIQ
jgi:hypothetical protein